MLPIDQDVPERLPLVDAFIGERLPAGYRLPATAAVLIQHQLGSIVPMTEALLSLGIDPRRLYWVDIPYSANEHVASRLRALGIPAGNFARTDYTLETPYGPYQHRRVTQLVARLRAELHPGERLLVLDDGGYFLEAAASFADGGPELAVVEQTRRGMMKLRGNAASKGLAETVRFVNVAESPPKLGVESVFIGESVVRALDAAIGARRHDVAAGTTLVLGYGAIGRAVAQALVRHLGVAPASVQVHDAKPEAMALARRDGFRPWDRSGPPFHCHRLVLGCSGTTSFGVGDRVFLAPDAILASTSSGAAELSREAFIELADADVADDIFVHERETLATRSAHSPIRVRVVDRDVTFLNGGFPINFDGAVNCVPAHQIQLTRALMLAGAVQALEAEEVGVAPLDVETCEWLVRRFGELGGERRSARVPLT